jgi:hypothetical protein
MIHKKKLEVIHKLRYSHLYIIYYTIGLIKFLISKNNSDQINKNQ